MKLNSRCNNKHNEYGKKLNNKTFLLKFKMRIFVNTILISSQKSDEIYLNIAKNNIKIISSIINNNLKNKAILKNIFSQKKNKYLQKEDFLKSAFNAASNINNNKNNNDKNNNNDIHYFKFKESLSKSKRIIDSYNTNLKENLDLEIHNQNPYLPLKKQSNKLRQMRLQGGQLRKLTNDVKDLKSKSEITNPCFFKGFYSNKTKIKGRGSYLHCFKQFNSTLGSKFAEMEDFSKNKTSVLLGSDFKDIADIIATENTSILNFNLLAEKICAEEYAEIKRKYYYIANVDNICFKLCYASVVFSKLFKNNEKIILIFSTNIKNISTEAENEIIMSNYFSFQAESIPPWILVLFMILILFFFCNYFFKEQIISVIKKQFYKNELVIQCFRGIKKLMSGKDDKSDEQGGNRVLNTNGNNNRTSRRGSFIVNISQNNAAGFDNCLRKDEVERDCITGIIDIVTEEESEFKEYFDNKHYLKGNINNPLSGNNNNNYNYINDYTNQFTLVNEYPVKTKESTKNNNNNNNNKNQSLSEEEVFYQKFNQEMNIANSEEKKDILDTLINSLPVKNFLYTVLLKKIKDLCEREIFLSFAEFKLFFYKEAENEIQLKLVILQTIEKRNSLKATKVFCLVQIIFAIILSVLTNKIFSFITFNNNYIQGIIIVLFSFLYMTLLIMECLILITLIDYEKYYYSNILTQSEKLFLEQEFSVEPNHNNELF